jgi:undecaprenyl-diphosphatase
VILGLTQGVSEFAPISSSGHLVLVPWLLGWPLVENADLNKTFDVALHMGTLAGALIFFRGDVVRYVGAWVTSVRARAIRTPEERLAWALVVGTIPGVIAGVLFERAIEEQLSQPWLIAVMLAVFGVVLWAVDRVAATTRDMDSIGPRTGLGLGIAQALALSPGVSRSGITITAARAIGLERGAAARFSFLLSLPIILGAGVYKLGALFGEGFHGYGSEFAWGVVTSAVSGYAVIAFLLRYLRRHSFAVFMWYRLGVAGLVALLIATGARPATV